MHLQKLQARTAGNAHALLYFNLLFYAYAATFSGSSDNPAGLRAGSVFMFTTKIAAFGWVYAQRNGDRALRAWAYSRA